MSDSNMLLLLFCVFAVALADGQCSDDCAASSVPAPAVAIPRLFDALLVNGVNSFRLTKVQHVKPFPSSESDPDPFAYMVEIESNALLPSDIATLRNLRSKIDLYPSLFGEAGCGSVVEQRFVGPEEAAGSSTAAALPVGMKLAFLSLSAGNGIAAADYATIQLSQPGLLVFPLTEEIPCQRAAGLFPTFFALSLIEDLRSLPHFSESVVIVAATHQSAIALALTQILSRLDVRAIHLMASSESDDADSDAFFTLYGATTVIKASSSSSSNRFEPIPELEKALAESNRTRVVVVDVDRSVSLDSLVATLSYEDQVVILDPVSLHAASKTPEVRLSSRASEHLVMTASALRGFALRVFLSHRAPTVINRLIRDTQELLADPAYIVPFIALEFVEEHKEAIDMITGDEQAHLKNGNQIILNH